jgi:hypothetical protein
MTIVKVYTDIGKDKPVILYAKIFNKVKKNVYQIKYLSPTSATYRGKTLYNYETVAYEVDESSITAHLDTDDEEVVGFTRVDNGFVKCGDDTDSDYEPGESSDSDSGTESLVDDEEEEASEVEDDCYDYD